MVKFSLSSSVILGLSLSAVGLVVAIPLRNPSDASPIYEDLLELHQGTPECAVSLSDKEDCGWPGITEAQCESRDCCFKKDQGPWCYRKNGSLPPLEADGFNLIVAHQRGSTSNCANLGCFHVSNRDGGSQGLNECAANCQANEKCNVFNFVPTGATGTSGVGRCCPRKCEKDLKLTKRWKGWNVYKVEETRTVGPPQRPLCCKENTASCLSCRAGDTKKQFCEKHPEVEGCPKKESRVCCQANTASCLSCRAGDTKKQFCEKHPEVEGCPKMCCQAMTASCLSCKDGVTKKQFCEKNPKTNGC